MIPGVLINTGTKVVDSHNRIIAFSSSRNLRGGHEPQHRPGRCCGWPKGVHNRGWWRPRHTPLPIVAFAVHNNTTTSSIAHIPGIYTTTQEYADNRADGKEADGSGIIIVSGLPSVIPGSCCTASLCTCRSTTAESNFCRTSLHKRPVTSSCLDVTTDNK